MFNGKTGIGVTEWVEEVHACIRARHLSVADQAFSIFDHFEGDKISLQHSEEGPGKNISSLDRVV